MKIPSLHLVLMGLTGLGFVGCHQPKSLPAPKSTTGIETDTQRQMEVVNQNTPDRPVEKTILQDYYTTLDTELKNLELRISKISGEGRIQSETGLEELKKRRSGLQIDFDQTKYNQLLADIQNSAPPEVVP